MEFIRKKMLHKYYFILCLIILSACKKADERTCIKGTGAQTELLIPINSISHFNLYKNIKYSLFQDSLNYIKIKGGENIVKLISVNQIENTVHIINENKCNFLRKYQSTPEVEIHAVDFRNIYVEPSDSVIFKNQIMGDSLNIEIRNGGGSLYINTIQHFMTINVSHGTGDYVLKGSANSAEIKIQNNGFADASEFEVGYLFAYNNSTGDLKLNLENTSSLILLEGTGNIIYHGSPNNMDSTKVGAGKIIKQ